MLNVVEMKAKMMDLGYYSNDELALNMSLLVDEQTKRDGINAVCLNGLPGTGKTFLAETMAKMMDAHYLTYSCVENTGMEQLLEDINLPELIKKNPDKAVNKGFILRAIELANSGKKVFLSIDEFDKSLRSTDFYFLEFLQSGKTTSNTFGDVALHKSAMKNLTVFVCMNKEREVHEALMRRFSKNIMIQPPSISTVRQILIDSNPDADDMMRDAMLSVYKMILDDGESYKKIATIQEMKNALYEDNTLRTWDVSEDDRLRNMMEHMAKFPQDREILDAKLKECGYQSVDEHLEQEQMESMGMGTLSMTGYASRVNELEMALGELQQVVYEGKSFAKEDSAKARDLAADGKELEYEPVEITPLNATVNRRTQHANYVLPRSVYNQLLNPMFAKPAMYENEQYIIGEFKLENKRGVRTNQAVEALTTAKTMADLEDVSYDGLVLTKNEFNKIGLIHYQETEFSPVRFYLVSQQPLLTAVQFAEAMQKLPRLFTECTQVAELNAVLVTDLNPADVQRNSDQVLNVSEDRSELVVDKKGVTMHYQAENKLLKLKVSTTKKVSSKVMTEVMSGLVKDNGVNQDHEFDHRNYIVTIDDIYKAACAQHGYESLDEVKSEFEKTQNESMRTFTTNAWSVNCNNEAEKLVSNRIGMAHEEFIKRFAVVRLDSDGDAYLTNIKNSQNAYVSLLRGDHCYGMKLDEFLRLKAVFEQNSTTDQIAILLNQRMLSGAEV